MGLCNTQLKKDIIQEIIVEKSIDELLLMIAEQASTELSSTSSISSESEKILDKTLSLSELIYELEQESNSIMIIKIIELIAVKINIMTLPECIYFWNNNSNVILSKIKHKPELCINLNMHILPPPMKIKCMERLGILIFDIHPNDAHVLLSNNIFILAKLIKVKNVKQSEYLASDNISNNILLKNAYTCLSNHKWGLSYILFKKANHIIGYTNVLKQHAPTYIKILINLE